MILDYGLFNLLKSFGRFFRLYSPEIVKISMWYITLIIYHKILKIFIKILNKTRENNIMNKKLISR